MKMLSYGSGLGLLMGGEGAGEKHGAGGGDHLTAAFWTVLLARLGLIQLC